MPLNELRFETTIPEKNAAVISSFSGSSADLNQSELLTIRVSSLVSKVDEDLPVVSLPADEFMSYVARN